MRIFYLLIAALIGLSGCAATGVQVKQGQLDQFKQGETTRQEVVAALGKPTTQMRNSDGTTTLLYTYAESRTRPETFIPFVGAFVGGVDTNSSHVTLTFDQAGKLLSYSSSESEMGTGMGMAAGQVEAVQNQPRKPGSPPQGMPANPQDTPI
ncbi:hypothetical protein CAL18_12530 [Bordetella genomosp. 7]|uniref:outer membrane protein assembly factor BamE domain-containing protein n=1 Tax=Bordetella genomosp. 7 TaxID=1416805 RepID=UPI000B9E5522|nr:outer membrane protein assembly factor BamE [Bordetella genomosp. 7]OZI21743.1 hypothetical protein CAL18_12530 [Bordetella genomosp. 7]